MKKHYLCLCFFVALSITAHSAVIRMAVFDYNSAPDYTIKGSEIASMISEQLISNSSLQIIRHNEVAEILREMDMSLSGMTDFSRLIQAGKAASLTTIVFGSVYYDNGRYFISTRIIDVETSKYISSFVIETKSFSRTIARQIAKNIIKTLNASNAGASHQYFIASEQRNIFRSAIGIGPNLLSMNARLLCYESPILPSYFFWGMKLLQVDYRLLAFKNTLPSTMSIVDFSIYNLSGGYKNIFLSTGIDIYRTKFDANINDSISQATGLEAGKYVSVRQKCWYSDPSVLIKGVGYGNGALYAGLGLKFNHVTLEARIFVLGVQNVSLDLYFKKFQVKINAINIYCEPYASEDTDDDSDSSDDESENATKTYELQGFYYPDFALYFWLQYINAEAQFKLTRNLNISVFSLVGRYRYNINNIALENRTPVIKEQIYSSGYDGNTFFYIGAGIVLTFGYNMEYMYK